MAVEEAGPGAPVFDNVNRVYEEVISRVEIALEAEVERAIASAQGGFLRWSALSGAERGRVLGKAADILRARNRELAELEVQDTGKPIQEAEAVDVASGADCIEYFAGVAGSLRGEQISLNKCLRLHAPGNRSGCAPGSALGTIRIQIACWKSAPALACGNAMIFPRHPEMTPTDGGQACRNLHRGRPSRRRLQRHSRGRTHRRALGQAMGPHRKVSLYGDPLPNGQESARSGRRLDEARHDGAWRQNPRSSLFPDADLHQAVSAAMLGQFDTQGEICTNCHARRRAPRHSRSVPSISSLPAPTKKLRVGAAARAGDAKVQSLISRPAPWRRCSPTSRPARKRGQSCVYGGERLHGRPPP